MPDEQTPDPSADLFANQNATSSANSSHALAPLVPATPQFSSRREMRSETPKNRVSRAPKSRPSSARPASRSPRLTRRERALARKLAVTPRVRFTPSKKPTKRQNPVLAVLVVLVVSGFVAGICLPAYAFTPVSPGSVKEAAAANTGHVQSVSVDATITSPKVSRDGIGATSEAELKAQQVTAASLVAATTVGLSGGAGTSGAYGTVAPHQAGDDYPWPTAGNSLSPLRYYYRQCVDFVAWRLNRDAGVTHAPWKWTWATLTPGGGDASAWKAAWENHGWKTSATPVVGSVAWFVGNHVAYVKSIAGSNVVIEEYNGMSSRSYAMRTIPIDTVGRFLYPPP